MRVILAVALTGLRLAVVNDLRVTIEADGTLFAESKRHLTAPLILVSLFADFPRDRVRLKLEFLHDDPPLRVHKHVIAISVFA